MTCCPDLHTVSSLFWEHFPLLWIVQAQTRSDRSQPTALLTYFPAGSPAGSPHGVHLTSFSRSGLSNVEAGFLLDTKPGTINCLALLKFQRSLSLAEEKGWGGLLFRTDNKCSRFEPKLATWSKLQVFKRQPFRYYETPGQSRMQTGKDLGIWRMVPLPRPFGDADRCMHHINTMSYFSSHMKGSNEASSPQIKHDCFVYLFWHLSSRQALWETSSQTYILLWFDKDKLYSVREKEEKFPDYSLNKKSRGTRFFLPSST